MGRWRANPARHLLEITTTHWKRKHNGTTKRQHCKPGLAFAPYHRPITTISGTWVPGTSWGYHCGQPAPRGIPLLRLEDLHNPAMRLSLNWGNLWADHLIRSEREGSRPKQPGPHVSQVSGLRTNVPLVVVTSKRPTFQSFAELIWDATLGSHLWSPIAKHFTGEVA